MFSLIYLILQIVLLLVLARTLLSWFPNIDRSNPIVQLIYDVTEPLLRPIRQVLPQTGMVDFSPMVLTLIIWLLMQVIRF